MLPAVSCALLPTLAVLPASAILRPTAAATPVSASVLVAVARPTAAASTALIAATSSAPLALMETPAATLAVLWVSRKFTATDAATLVPPPSEADWPDSPLDLLFASLRPPLWASLAGAFVVPDLLVA